MFFQVEIECLKDKNIDFKELRHVKSENTTIGEFVSDLLTKRKVDAVRIGDIIRQRQSDLASETPCILIHKSFGHRYIFVTVTETSYVSRQSHNIISSRGKLW